MKLICACGEEAVYFYKIDRLNQIHCRCPAHRLQEKYPGQYPETTEKDFIEKIRRHVSAVIRKRPKRGLSLQDLHVEFSSVGSRMLVDWLRELELDGVIRRENHPHGTQYFYVRVKERVLRAVMDS